MAPPSSYNRSHDNSSDPYSRRGRGSRGDDSRSTSDRPRYPNNNNRSRTSVPSKRTAHDADEDAWVASEDKFVLQQAKQRAFIRVREGRARPIDWLAIVARVLFDRPGTQLSLDGDQEEEEKVEIVDPEGVFASLRTDDLKKLKTELDTFCGLETNPEGRKYWNTMQTICNHKLKNSISKSSSSGGGAISIDAEVEKLLANKTEADLARLERQVRSKLDSQDCVDVEYWENLLLNMTVLKEKAHLKTISQAVITKRLERLRKQQEESTELLLGKLCGLLNGSKNRLWTVAARLDSALGSFDPEPMLSLRQEDKHLRSVNEGTLLAELSDERANLRKLRYVPARSQHERDRELDLQLSATRKRAKLSSDTAQSSVPTSRFALPGQDSESSSNAAAAAAAVAEGAATGTIDNDEEILHAEEMVMVQPDWANQYKARKPRYFNRVVMGYEWNKYNQTHYDHDNPPPKVPQGYKFNIFYPDLIERTKAPTYRIEREKRNKNKGPEEPSVPSGEQGVNPDSSSGMFDTCLIRFISGAPYEDICFRIVDREWDFSAKRERAFKSNFTERGLLELHFQFKKIYYRK